MSAEAAAVPGVAAAVPGVAAAAPVAVAAGRAENRSSLYDCALWFPLRDGGAWDPRGTHPARRFVGAMACACTVVLTKREGRR